MTLWLLGGHDPTHGAGLFRDLLTARLVAPALPRRFCVTARTAQGTGVPARAWPAPAGRLGRKLARWPAPSAVKVGLVPDGLGAEVAQLLRDVDAPVVVDPVLHASDGGALGATVVGLAPLLRRATLITPNRSEARALIEFGSESGSGVEAEPESAETLARTLGRRFGHCAVLLKDGHGTDPARVVDRLIEGEQITPFARPRRPGPDPRGTGCALATAIAVGLAQGRSLTASVRDAVVWLDRQRTHWILGSDGRAHLPDHDVGAPRSAADG